jgi:hypothetical protein
MVNIIENAFWLNYDPFASGLADMTMVFSPSSVSNRTGQQIGSQVEADRDVHVGHESSLTPKTPHWVGKDVPAGVTMEETL